MSLKENFKMDWEECCNKKIAKSVIKDKALITSLIASSKRKQDSNKLLILNETTATTKISIAYDSIRELLEAITLEKGYKIYNHECYTAFLYHVCNERATARIFDGFRHLRNQINYYGKTIPKEEAIIILKEMEKLAKLLHQKKPKST